MDASPTNFSYEGSNSIDSLEKVSQLLTDYGVPIVICACMIILFIAIMAYVINSNKKSTQNFIEQNNRMVNSLIEQNKALITSFEALKCSPIMGENYDRKQTVNIFIQLNSVLKEACKSLQGSTDAGRSAVYVFHNGSVSSHGFPFFKMTCVCEWVKRGSGFVNKATRHQALTLTVFYTLTEAINTNNSPIRYNVNEITDSDPLFAAWMEENGVDTCFIQGIYGRDNTTMGFVIIEYNHDIQFNKEIKDALEDACEACAPVLEYSDVNSYKMVTT